MSAPLRIVARDTRPPATLDALEARAELREEVEQAQIEQIQAAERATKRPADAYLPQAWEPLQRVVGGTGPGTITTWVGPSGNGKTTAVLTAIERMQQRGERVFVVGTETQPQKLRQQMACRACGVDFGAYATGALQRRTDWPAIQGQLNRAFVQQRSTEAQRHLQIADGTFLDPKMLERSIAKAVAFGATCVFVDHLDNLTDEGHRSGYDAGKRTMQMLLALTQRHGLRVIATSQANLTGLANDPLRYHRPIRREQVRNGGFKLEMSDVVLGIYRPLRRDLDRGTLQDWRDGRIELSRILAPNTAALNVMKHRALGAREGEVILLGYENGTIIDNPPPADGDHPVPWYDRS